MRSNERPRVHSYHQHKTKNNSNNDIVLLSQFLCAYTPVYVKWG